jgi:hypothetical protein
MKKCINWLFRAFLVLVVFLAVRQFCRKQTDGFTLVAITSHRPFDAQWETTPDDDFFHAVDQPYTYFGCGAQSYVFFSRDQRFVLKLFKQDAYQLPLWLHVPLPWPFARYQKKKQQSRSEKLLRDFTSYTNAFKQLKEETGLLHVHLNKTNTLHRSITLIDRLGISHQIVLDDVDFILQKKAVMAYEQIDYFMQQDAVERAKNALSSLLLLIAKQCQYKMIDRHPNIQKNFGFIDDRALQIDIGRFKDTIDEQGIEQMHQELYEWLQAEHPSLVEYFETRYDETVKTQLALYPLL